VKPDWTWLLIGIVLGVFVVPMVLKAVGSKKAAAK
jgi:hypothetical protein